MNTSGPPPSVATRPPPGQCSVLVVGGDDEPRRLLEHALRREERWSVTAVATASAARAALADRWPGAVVLDLDLPDGDGMAFLHELTARAAGPVVVLTAAASIEAAQRAMRGGAADLILKTDGHPDLVGPALARAVGRAELTRAAREQRIRTEAFIQLDALKSALVARLGHELRTPLTYVVGYAELLAHRAFDAAQTQQMADEILHEARALSAIVDAMLTLDARDRTDYSLRPTRLPVETAVVGAWASLANRQAHALELALAPGLEVWADEALLEQLLAALLENAVLYSPDGGAVRVSADPRDGGVRVEVEDSGIGFDPELADRLFEAFFRAEGDHAHRVRGIGLGLTDAKAIVTAHGGRISARSAGHGAGANVAFWLPGPEVPSQSTPEAARPRPADAPGSVGR